MVARKFESGRILQDGERGVHRNLADPPPFWSPDVTSNRPHKPPRPKRSLLGSSPLIPALFLLLAIVLLPSSKWFRQSVHSAFQFPVIQRISVLIHGQKKQQLLPNMKVWAKKQSGFYYCPGNILFGTKQGRLVTQEKALTSGYRPAGGQYCTADNATEVSRYNEPSPKSLGAR
jgi:hypothetical protein